jgi:hypothetical protein
LGLLLVMPKIEQRGDLIRAQPFAAPLLDLSQWIRHEGVPRWPGQIPPPLATPNSPRQDDQIMTTRV